MIILSLCPPGSLRLRATKAPIFRRKPVPAGLRPSQANSRERKRNTLIRSSNEPAKESRFFDENGVVEDMDGYLNYLSLEYDSVWDTKPSWCQPWTIVLTGTLIIIGSWLILQSVLATSLVFSVIGAWWYIFLYSYPKAYTEMIAERRKQVVSGVEDTFGFRNNP